MKILYVCHRLPFPPKRGGKIRPFNMISHLAQDHEVTVASLARSDQELAEGAGLADHCAKVLADVVAPMPAWLRMGLAVPLPGPSTFQYFWSARLKARIDAELASGSYDLIFVHCSSVAPYVADYQGCPKILDFGDMDSQKWYEYARYRRFPLALGFALEARKVERAERRLARQFDTCTCTTRQELDTLRGFNVAHASDWFANGVDATFFAPGDEPVDPDLISFVGRMDYFPNQQCMFDFCDHVLPKIQARRPGARLSIIGADPTPAVRRLAERPGVDVTGSVPDVRPHVRASAVNVAPLIVARGTQNKILEAMAMGRPVVASSLAAKGVDAVPGEHLLTADSHADIATAVLGLLGDPARAVELGAAARLRVLSNHSWPASMARLDGIIEATLAGRGQIAGSA